ncbi:J domain-containing protein [Desulfobacula phenolica]|uniref:DnaJ domain-containing protein n=1 Tax=Desulfobacula phenolica TaxID=90732 RepID=A0A1H2I1F9_9BACT|nr:J domain-containing protein [Desulfobacula phenolica]SDU37939.1 DnaJ domain-containing protein [Desulfobacula phenolica]
MDKKTAFHILNLKPGVSFEDAKKSYRNLAKKYHPDRAEKKIRQQRTAESKMKEINLAFRYIAPLLRNTEDVKKTTEKNYDNETIKDQSERHEKEVTFSFLSKLIGRLIIFFNNKNHGKIVKNKFEKQKPVKKTSGKKVRFDDVFKSIYQVGSDGEKKTGIHKKKKYAQKINPYKGYQNYMTLKAKMSSGQYKRHQPMSIGRVDKIDPVKPVNFVGKK